MKFLCVTCDEPMKLQTTDSPGGGSLSVVYACPSCSHQMAMLTNPMETELVNSLGVKIGPDGQQEATASKCPFSGVVQEMEATAAAGDDGVGWTAEALARLENIPDFVRPMAKQGVEHYAKSNGYARIDEQVLDKARDKFGM